MSAVKRVPVRIVIEVDVDGWRAEYGTDESFAEIRASLRWSIGDTVRIAFAHLDCVTVTT